MIVATQDQDSRAPVMKRRLITAAEYAELLKVPRTTAYDSIRRLPAGVRVKVGRLVRVDADALAAWLDQGGDLQKESKAS